jgi:hypothetical protein
VSTSMIGSRLGEQKTSQLGIVTHFSWQTRAVAPRDYRSGPAFVSSFSPSRSIPLIQDGDEVTAHLPRGPDGHALPSHSVNSIYEVNPSPCPPKESHAYTSLGIYLSGEVQYLQRQNRWICCARKCARSCSRQATSL